MVFTDGILFDKVFDWGILKQLLLEAISKVSGKGGDVHRVVFDGASRNLAIAQNLGCDIFNFDGSFNQPSKKVKSMSI